MLKSKIKNVTKKEIGDFLGNIKNHEEAFGWNFWKAGSFIFNNKVTFYMAFHGQGLNEVVYNGTYDAHIDLTQYVTDWLNGEHTKVDIMNYIYDDVIEMIEEYENSEE